MEINGPRCSRDRGSRQQPQIAARSKAIRDTRANDDHARATCVKVTLEQTPTQACVTVQDDGIGFQAEEIHPRVTYTGGFGLFSIREQMNNLGGLLTIQTAPGEGAKIMLCVPKQDLLSY